MSGDLIAHLTEVCSEFEHVCLLKSIKSRSTSAHNKSSDQTHCTINWSVQWVCSHMDMQVDSCKGGFWWGGVAYIYIYIYILGHVYGMFSMNITVNMLLNMENMQNHFLNYLWYVNQQTKDEPCLHSYVNVDQRVSWIFTEHEGGSFQQTPWRCIVWFIAADQTLELDESNGDIGM